RLMLAVEAAKYIVLGRPLDVVADEKIEQSIAVEIKPQSGRAHRLAAAQAARFSNIDKGSLAGVFEQAILADAGNKDVGITVVVVVSDGNPHAVHLDVEPGAAGHVGKCSVAIVAIEPERAGLRLKAALMSGPIGAVHQKNVLPAVAVVVEEGTTGAERFGQQLAAVSAVVVQEANSRLGSYVHQPETGIGCGRCGECVQAQERCRRQTCHSPEERPAVQGWAAHGNAFHGRSTSPLRIAQKTNS